MFNQVKMACAAAAIALLPMGASAATVMLNEGGTTAIELGNEYAYQETVAVGGPGAVTFDLDSSPIALALAASFVTLEFTGTFTDLMISLTDNNGTTAATLLGATPVSSTFTLETIFNATNGFVQTLDISWSDVELAAGPNSTAQFNIQAVPSQVPVPAAGLLLLGALGGVATMRRRKKA